MLLHQVVEQGMESEGKKKWIIAGIPSWPPLLPINTKQVEEDEEAAGAGGGEAAWRATTPTTRESRIPAILPCPPAPKKGRPPLRCQKKPGTGGGVEFFSPPDLETVFFRRAERAK